MGIDFHEQPGNSAVVNWVLALNGLCSMGRHDENEEIVSQFRWEIRSGLMFALYFSLPWFLFALCSCMNLCCGTPAQLTSPTPQPPPRKSENHDNFDNLHSRAISDVWFSACSVSRRRWLLLTCYYIKILMNKLILEVTKRRWKMSSLLIENFL